MRVSLRLKLLLLLPLLGLLLWLGWRYFNAINSVVDQSQLQAASRVAEAVASNIRSAELPPLVSLNPLSGQPLSVYALHQPLTLDGFFGDWPRHHPLTELGRIRLRAAQWRDRLYLAIEVDDASRYYLRPRTGGYEAFETRRQHLDPDYIELRFDAGQRRYRLMAEAPGRFLALPLQLPLARTGQALPIDAVWWELADRYQLELELPLELLSGSSNLEILMHDVSDPVGQEQGSQEQRHALRLLPLRPALQNILAHYSQVEQQLLVLDGQQEVVAISEGLGPRALGRLLGFLESGQEQLIDAGWSTVRVAIDPGHPAAGQVVVQVVSDAVSQVQRKTLFDLGWQTLGVLLAVIAGLLLFASRLAYRIQRLSRELKAQYDRAGRLRRQQPFSELTATDEVGELAVELEELLNRLARYTQFLERVPRTLRHELSNPLNTISTSLELLEADTDPEQQQRLIGSAQRGVSKLEKTIQSITAAVSLEEALQQQEPCEINLNTLLRDYTERCQLSYPQRRFELQLPSQALSILGNELRLEQLLDKLIDNAVDFTPNSQPNENPILLSLRADKGIELAVSNRGSPIDTARIGGLFELFSGDRNDGSGEHLGLGLYVVRLIAESLGAQASIANEGDRVVVRIRWQPLN
jgi:two-component system sensor histidine kinase ChvG